MTKANAKKITKLSDLSQDDHNANVGTDRGKHMIHTSLEETGAWRSVGADKNGVLGVGNKTVEQWKDLADDDDVIVVQTDGTKLVVVQRTDLDFSDDEDGKARLAAMMDNRSGELDLSWSAQVLLEHANTGVEIEKVFLGHELETMFSKITVHKLYAGDAPTANEAAATIAGVPPEPDEESTAEDPDSPAQKMEADGPKPDNDTTALEAHVRMVQLFFNGVTHPVFSRMESELREKLLTNNVTDTVWESVKYAHQQLCPEAYES